MLMSASLAALAQTAAPLRLYLPEMLTLSTLPSASIAVLVLCITALAVNSYNPFIYFRF